MKLSQNILFTIILVITIFSAVTYIACNNKDKCLNVVCLNGGACDGGKCSCLVGFQGPRCDSLCRDKFVSIYSGGDSCEPYYALTDTTYRQYANQLRLTARLYYPLELLMTNFLDNPQDSAVCTMVAIDSFTFLGANNSTSYLGTGRLSNDSLFLQYRVIHDTTSYYCTFRGLKY